MRRGRWPDQVVRVVGLVGYSVPVFWLGLMGLLLFYAQLGWVGRARAGSTWRSTTWSRRVTGSILIDSALAGEWDVFGNALSHIILPASMLGYFSLAYIARMTRSFMLEQLGQEYVTTARVKGLSERRVVWLHALGNVLVPLITVDRAVLRRPARRLGADRDGLRLAGPRALHHQLAPHRRHERGARRHDRRRDVFIGLNLLSDLLYRLVDPRAR